MNSKKAKRPHTKEVGTERCGHTCMGRMCTNMKGSLDWEKEGHAVRRHEVSRMRHPQCGPDCPRNNRLQRSSQSGKEGKRPNKGSASPSEGLGGEVDNEMDIDPPSPSNVPVAGSSTTLDGI